jgi:hypothetical protein
MDFQCSYRWEDGKETWTGTITRVKSYGSHHEILIGKSSSGLFACIPDFDAGCHLSTLDDTFYNGERLVEVMGNAVDGTTVAYALKALSGCISFE